MSNGGKLVSNMASISLSQVNYQVANQLIKTFKTVLTALNFKLAKFLRPLNQDTVEFLVELASLKETPPKIK